LFDGSVLKYVEHRAADLAFSYGCDVLGVPSAVVETTFEELRSDLL